MKITFIAAIAGFALLIASIMGCSMDTVGGIETFSVPDPEKDPIADAVLYYPNNIKVSATDDPLDGTDLEKVHIKFDRLEVSMSEEDDEDAEWIPINEEGGEFNLLELTNGTCQTLALAELGIGKYRQTRVRVSEAIVEENMIKRNVHLADKNINIRRDFDVIPGMMTNLVLDFDAQRSLQKVGEEWVMTPLIRFIERYNTGAIVGRVIIPEDSEATAEVTEGTIEGTTDEVTEGTAEGTTEEVMEGTTEGTTEEVTEGTTEGTTEEVTEGTTEGTTEEVTEGTTEGTTEEVADGTIDESLEGLLGITDLTCTETDIKATITAYKDGETESYASTIAYRSGVFILGYLESGVYDIEIKAGAEDEYFLRIENVEVVIGQVVRLGELVLQRVEPEPEEPPVPIINTITVNVTDDVHMDVDQMPVLVTIFNSLGRVPENAFETVKGEIIGTSASVVLDNSGAGYPDGTYGILAHIDLNRDGILTKSKGQDYIALGEVTVSGGSSVAAVSGPWGTYFGLTLINIESPLDTGIMYIALVSQGSNWINYAYGENVADPPLGIRTVDCWAPEGAYDLLVFIDTNNNKADTIDPDTGDWVASRAVTVQPDGSVLDPVWSMTIDSWSEVP